MWNRNSIGSIVVFFLLFVDMFIYKYQKAYSPKEIILCYPAAKVHSQKDVFGSIKYDSAFHSRSNFKLND